MFPKNHALHTARYGVPRSALDHDQLTHSTPQSLTVSAAVWPPPRPPSLSLSLSLSLSVRVCGRLPHAPAERGKTPAWSPMLSTQLWPPGGSSHAGLWPTHDTQLTHFVGHTVDVLAWHQITAYSILHSPRVELSGPRWSRLAALLPIFSSRVCIRGRSYVQGNNRRGCD